MAKLYLLLAICAEVIATTCLKSTENFSKLMPSLLVAAGYIVSFYFLSLVVRSMPIGIAYAIWCGMGIVLVSLAAYFFYQQKLDLPAIIGMALILIGVLVINLFSKSAGH